MEGKQVVVVDEFDKKTTFYKIWAVEHDIRDSSKKMKNTYTIGLFACCREIFSNQNHRGYIGGTILQALVHFDRAEHQAHIEKTTESIEDLLRKEIMLLKQENM